MLWKLRLLGCIVLSSLVFVVPSAQANNRELRNDVQSSIPPNSDLLAQTEPVQITGVRVDKSDRGLETIFTSPAGNIPLPTAQTSQNTIVYDLPNTVLALPNAAEYRADNPASGILSIVITQFTPNTARITITGTDSLPDVKTATGATGLTLSITPLVATTDQEIDINVIGRLRNSRSYKLPNASTATKTDTPIKDIPNAIQIVPIEVIKDQSATRVEDAVRNVSGVNFNSNGGGRAAVFRIRGFSSFNSQFKNGLLDDFFTNRIAKDTANVERIEVLKGPASVLFGRTDPSGLINVITKKPLATPATKVDLTVGSFNTYRPTVDVSGLLNPEGSLKYRVNAAYENAGSFRDGVNTNRIFIAPVLSWDISPKTNLTFEVEYAKSQQPIDRGIVALGTGVANIPISRFLGDPKRQNQISSTLATLTLKQELNTDWSLSSALRYGRAFEAYDSIEPGGTLGADNRIRLDAFLGQPQQDYQTYFGQVDLTGKFKTGSIDHNLLFGVELAKLSSVSVFQRATAGSTDIFNPSSQFTVGPFSVVSDDTTAINTAGIYLQDQISLSDKVKLVLGGRFDTYTSQDADRTVPLVTTTNTQAFSPRIGIVYQPTNQTSIYGNYSQSFLPQSGRSATGAAFGPERGAGYEIGVKNDFFDGRLTATLAAYQINRSDVLTTDPNNADFSISVGKQRSQGLELDLAGEVLPGLKLIGSYAYTDAIVSQDNDIPVGNRLNNVPSHSGSLWANYKPPSGNLQGWGAGLGLFAVGGDRPGDLENSFTLPGYTRVDAALYYEKNDFNAALNFKNLFGAQYFEGAQSRRNVTPGTPFSVGVTVGLKF